MSKSTIFRYTLISFGAVLTLAVVATLAFAGGLALSPQLYAVAQAADEESVVAAGVDAGEEAVVDLEQAQVRARVDDAGSLRHRPDKSRLAC